MYKNKEIKEKIKQDFPFFKNNPEVVYLDSAATTQKPESVILAVSEYYEKYNFSVEGLHAGNIFLQKLIGEMREKTLKFLNAGEEYECIFTKSATESFNLLAFGLENVLPAKTKILTTEMEHHANLLPWQRLVEKMEGELKFVPVDFTNGVQEEDILEKVKEVDLLALTHLSNVTGQVIDLEKIILAARKINPKIIVVVDGSQAVSQLKIVLKKIEADFYIFSAHKLYGPLGLGFLIGKKEILNRLNPLILGGKMIERVEKNSFKKAALPYFLEAGTPNGEVLYAFKETLKFLENAKIGGGEENYEFLENELLKIKGVKILSQNAKRKGVLSFLIEGVDAFDLNLFLSENNVLIRVGNHCCQPLMQSLKIDGTIRVSFGVYTTKKDVDIFLEKLKGALKILN